MIRFGMWQEIIDTPLPDDPELYCVTTAMIALRQGRGVSRRPGASPRPRSSSDCSRPPSAACPNTRYHGIKNSCLDVLAIAREMLAGELEYRKGNYDDAFAHLRESIELYDGLAYAEPWAWMQPVRHAWARLLLEQGRVEEAEAVYRGRSRPGWHAGASLPASGERLGLHGYHEVLMRQGKHHFCGIIKQRLDIAVRAGRRADRLVLLLPPGVDGVSFSSRLNTLEPASSARMLTPRVPNSSALEALGASLKTS